MNRPGPTRRFEGCWKRRGCACVAGVDEAGRGCLAGPVVAGAVVLGRRAPRGIDDSKRLSREQRERLLLALGDSGARIAWAEASPEEIDRLNIRRASFLAMRRAVERLGVEPDALLVDGFEIPGLGLRQRALIHGDALSVSIAAASIVAKVTRDRAMRALAETLPGYGFERHFGYPTREHLAALERLGPTPWHRRSFEPVRRVLAGQLELGAMRE
ncbi:MAG: ribonuclease HII [Candidatus Eisenbacteria bacterium]|uniref:Ribonuclease HII n=1 Tax=Eiseniibacteriota bacterium TaxID=2212470 RepID=A0A937X9V7_UNCEI|nr:ribonuclease HII [Candidatus Eisenbacteria bacterium]